MLYCDLLPERPRIAELHLGMVHPAFVKPENLAKLLKGLFLVFGLLFQRLESIQSTVAKTLELRPDRIAFYSYAHVPWIKGNGQRGFRDQDLPSGEEKRTLYEIGLAMLKEGGYHEIGMDYFTLPHDAMYQAMQTSTLHRNFMGYTTTTRTQVLLGLGASSISDVWTAFAQNEKDVDAYIERVQAGELPLTRGHVLNPEDQWVRRQILNIMCGYGTQWELSDWTQE